MRSCSICGAPIDHLNISVCEHCVAGLKPFSAEEATVSMHKYTPLTLDTIQDAINTLDTLNTGDSIPLTGIDIGKTTNVMDFGQYITGEYIDGAKEIGMINDGLCTSAVANKFAKLSHISSMQNYDLNQLNTILNNIAAVDQNGKSIGKFKAIQIGDNGIELVLELSNPVSRKAIVLKGEEEKKDG